MRVLSSQGDLVDSYDPALKEHRTVCFLAFDGRCYMYRAVKRVLERQAARVLYRGEARQTLPPIGEWRRFDAVDVQPGLFWREDLREARRQLMAAGESPKVAISSPAQSSFSLALACSSVGHASSPTRSHFTKLKMPGSERMFSVSSCLCPPARSRMSWLQHGRQLPEVSQQQELHVGVQPHAGQVRPERHVQLRDLLHHQPVQLLRAAPAHVPAHPVVGRLRPQAQVLRGAVRLGHQVHRLALLSQPHHNRPGQVRLSGAHRPVSSRELPARQWLIS